VFTERLMPLLRDLEEVRLMPITRDMSPDHRGRVAMAKANAGPAVELLRSLLFPKDDDGG
jgi:hypothetical protein